METALLDKYLLSSPAAEDEIFVTMLRRYLGDTAELNTLESIQESTDRELYDALLDTLQEINGYGTPITSYTAFRDLPSWTMLRSGAVLNILTMKGILSARNTLTYRDAGGVTVQDYDKYGRYINYFNILMRQYYEAVRSFKTSTNIDSCYGGSDGVGVPSEYGTIYGE